MLCRVAAALVLSFSVSASFAQSKKTSKAVPAVPAKVKPSAKAPTKPKSAAKLGVLAYPEGRWEGLHTYNTPFEGIDADFASPAALVLRVTDLKGIAAGAKITHYRLSEDGDYAPVTDWASLLEAAKDAEGSEIWVKGVDKAKHPFATSLSILSDDVWTAPDEKPELENLIPGVTLKYQDGGVDVTFARPDAPLAVGAILTGIYVSAGNDPLPVDDLRALADQIVKAGAGKVDLAVRVNDGLTVKVTVPVDVTVAKRWLGLEAPEADPIETCLAGVDGTPGASAKISKVKAGPLRPGDVVTGARRPGGASFAKIATWQDLADFIDAAGRPKTIDLRVTRASGETEIVSAVGVR